MWLQTRCVYALAILLWVCRPCDNNKDEEISVTKRIPASCRPVVQTQLLRMGKRLDSAHIRGGGQTAVATCRISASGQAHYIHCAANIM